MKKASSCSTYSEFRKKNLNTEVTLSSNPHGFLEIDQLSKQLQSLAVKNKRSIQQRFQHPNQIIEELEEQDYSYATKNKTSKAPQEKLGKILNNKMPQKSTNQVLKKKTLPSSSSSSKMNKTLQLSLSAKNLQDQILTQRIINNASSVTAYRKQPALGSRRMSLTGGVGNHHNIGPKTNGGISNNNNTHSKHNNSGNNSSSNNKINNQLLSTGSTNTMSECAELSYKKQLLSKIDKIRSAISNKDLSWNRAEQLGDRLEQVLAVLNAIK